MHLRLPEAATVALESLLVVVVDLVELDVTVDLLLIR